MQDLAAAEKIHPSYLSRVLWLTLLAPDIVEAILDGTTDMRESPDRILVTMASWRRVQREAGFRRPYSGTKRTPPRQRWWPARSIL